MAEKKGDRIDSLIKVGSFLVTIAGVMIGIVQFNSQQRQNETHQFRIKLWERKFDTYTRLSKVTGDLVVLADQPDPARQGVDSLMIAYSKLYYAAMPMVQDTAVESKLIDFNLALIDYNNNIKGIVYLRTKQYRLMQGLGASIQHLNSVMEDE